MGPAAIIPLLVAGLVVTTGTAVAGAIASKQQADKAAAAAMASGQFEAAAAIENVSLNRQIAERNAQIAIRRAGAQAEIVGKDRQRRLGLARAFFGGSGVELTGSPLDNLADRAASVEQELAFIREGGAEDATTARFAGELAARNEVLRAAGISYSAELESRALRSAGWGALIGGLGQAAGGALTGAGMISYYGGLGPQTGGSTYFHPDTFVGRAR